MTTPPTSTTVGTGPTRPVSVVAGFSTWVTVALFRPGAVSVTRSSTVFGSVTPIGFAVRDALAGVFHETSAFRNIGEREYAPSVNARATHAIAPSGSIDGK